VLDALATCRACQAPVSGAYCPACGQRTDTARLELIPFLRNAVSNLLDVDRGYLYTFVELIRNPGARIRAYLAGERVRMVHPIRYFTLALTLLLVAGELLGVDTPITFYERALLRLVESLGMGAAVPTLQMVFDKLDVLFFLSVLALYTTLFVLSIRLTRHLPYNLAEVLVFLLFTGAEVLFALLPLALLGLLHLPGYLVLNALAVPVFFIYQAYAAVGFFSKQRGRAVGIVLSANARVLLFMPIVLLIPALLVKLGQDQLTPKNAQVAAMMVVILTTTTWLVLRLLRWVQAQRAEARRQRLQADIERRLENCDPAARPYLEAAHQQLATGQRPTALRALKANQSPAIRNPRRD